MRSNESDWLSLYQPEHILEAIRNLTRANFQRFNTNPEMVRRRIRFLQEIGFIPEEEARELTEKIDKLANPKKRKRK